MIYAADAADVLGAARGLEVLAASGTGVPGSGRLRVRDGLVSWAGPGREYGPAVAVSGGVALIRGDSHSHWVVVSVTPEQLANDEATVRLAWRNGGPVGLRDATAEEAVAGAVTAWPIILRPAAPGGVSLRVWLDPVTARYHAVSFLQESGFVSPVDRADAIATVMDGVPKSLYMRRSIPPDTPPQAAMRMRILFECVAGDQSWRGELGAWWNVRGPAGYVVSVDVINGLMPPPPEFHFAGNTYTLPTEFSPGEYRVRLARHSGVYATRSCFSVPIGVSSENLPAPPRPRAPSRMWLEPRAGGVVRVHALYSPRVDFAARATGWAVWHSTSGMPSTASPPSIVEPLGAGSDWAILRRDLPPVGDGQRVYVAVALQNAAGFGPAATADAVARSGATI